MNKGGYRPGAGRKPKAEEIELIERLTPFDKIALKELEKGIKRGDFAFIKLFMEYRFGKPKEKIDIKQTSMQAPVIVLRRAKECNCVR